MKEKKNRFLEFLKTYASRLSIELEIIQQYCLEHQEPMEEPVELVEREMKLSFVFYTSKEKGKTTFRLVINKIRNPNQTENWEITTRYLDY